MWGREDGKDNRDRKIFLQNISECSSWKCNENSEHRPSGQEREK